MHILVHRGLQEAKPITRKSSFLSLTGNRISICDRIAMRCVTINTIMQREGSEPPLPSSSPAPAIQHTVTHNTGRVGQCVRCTPQLHKITGVVVQCELVVHTVVSEEMATVEGLPGDVLLNIFSYLNYQCLKDVLLVSKRFNTLASSPWLWRKYQLNISDKNIKHLKNILNLQRFGSLRDIKFVNTSLDDSHFHIVMGSTLQSVVIGDDKTFDNDTDLERVSPEMFGKMFNKLRSFSLNNWDLKLSESQVVSMLLNMNMSQRLKHLKIVTDQPLGSIPLLSPALSNLTSLTLTSQNISLKPLFSQLKANCKLQLLDLSHNSLVDIGDLCFSAVLVKIQDCFQNILK